MRGLLARVWSGSRGCRLERRSPRVVVSRVPSDLQQRAGFVTLHAKSRGRESFVDHRVGWVPRRLNVFRFLADLRIIGGGGAPFIGGGGIDRQAPVDDRVARESAKRGCCEDRGALYRGQLPFHERSHKRLPTHAQRRVLNNLVSGRF